MEREFGELIARLAAGAGLVRESIARLRALDLRDPVAADAARYRLIVAVEGATDIGITLLAERGGRPPESYPDVFLALARAGVISVGLADQLALVARLRDRLVHSPADVADAELAAGVELAGRSLPEFLKLVAGFAGADPARWA
jgi:uncharacterized protein YutE (UPF0331/DUF86 family)